MIDIFNIYIVITTLHYIYAERVCPLFEVYLFVYSLSSRLSSCRLATKLEGRVEEGCSWHGFLRRDVVHVCGTVVLWEGRSVRGSGSSGRSDGYLFCMTSPGRQGRKLVVFVRPQTASYRCRRCFVCVCYARALDRVRAPRFVQKAGARAPRSDHVLRRAA